MGKNLKKAVSILLVVSILCTTALAAEGGTGEAIYANTTQLAEGFSYTNEISYNSSGKRVEKHYTQLSTKSDIYPIVMACDTIYGGMTPKSVITYAESLGYNVISAINTDFFSMSNGIPIGIVIENGEYRSSPENRNALYFNDRGTYVAENVSVNISLYNNGGSETVDETTGEIISNVGKTTALTHFNKLRQNGGGMYLFSSAFSTVSTRTSTDGWAIRFKILEGSMTVSGQMQLEVVEKYEGAEALTIGDEYLILTADTTSGLYGEFEKYAVGDVVTLTTTCSHKELSSAEWASGCGDVLVSNGQMTDSSGWDSGLFGYHPRTVLGIKNDGTILSYVVEGRLEDRSYGAKLSEVSGDLIALGCTTVINLDGGGSSALSLRMPGSNASTIVNKLSDTYQRKCSTYILFVTDSQPDNVARRLFLAEDGAIILAGSSFDLNFYASDSGYKSVDAPGTVTAVSSGLGNIKNGVYTAKHSSGTDTITISNGAVRGTATVHIINSADEIAVLNADNGTSVDLENVPHGETVQLEPVFSYNKRHFIMDRNAVKFSVEGRVGTITEDGLFTVTGTPGATGTITVSGAGVSKTIPVSVKAEFFDTKGHWAEPYIDVLFQAGITTGTSDSTYSPDINMARGDFILMLWRAAGKPAATADTLIFNDVKKTDYFADAIIWAAEQGIALGDENNNFNPRAGISRQDAFTLLYRALGVLRYTDIVGNETLLTRFFDHSEISSYARKPMAALVSLGIVEGSGGYLNPRNDITRGEIAKILCVSLYSKG